MMSKKGIFFAIDAVIAMTILVVGILLIFAAFIADPVESQQASLAISLMNVLETSRVGEFAKINKTAIDDIPGVSLNDDISTAFGLMYKQGEWDLINDTIQKINGGAISEPFGFDFSINGTLLYQTDKADAQQVEAMVPIRKIAVGVDNETNLWGPYVIEVRVW